VRRVERVLRVEAGGGVKRSEKSDCLPLRLPVRIVQARQMSRQASLVSPMYEKKEAVEEETNNRVGRQSMPRSSARIARREGRV
jgi:hypothetical protein